MTHTPKRIYADAKPGEGGFWACDAEAFDKQDTEYIRADIATPKVKPLAWVLVTDGPPKIYDAIGCGNLYRVVICADGTAHCRPNGTCWLDETDHASEAEAFDAAQAIHERRIRDALE